LRIVNARDFKILDELGYIIHSGENRNYNPVNRGKKSRRKKYAIVCNDADPQRKWSDPMYVAIRKLLSGKMPLPYNVVMQKKQEKRQWYNKNSETEE